MPTQFDQSPTSDQSIIPKAMLPSGSTAPVAQSTQMMADKSERPENYKSPEWVIVYVTILLMLATGFLAVYTARLFKATVRLAEDAKKSSEHQRNLERPWLCIDAIRVERREGAPIQPQLLNNWFISFRWKNVGRSPAVIESCTVKIEDKTTLPETPDYTNAGPLAHNATLAAGEMFETGKIGPAPERGHKDGKAIQFLVYGVLTYQALNGETYKTGFAVDVSPHLPAASHDRRAGYAYYE